MMKALSFYLFISIIWSSRSDAQIPIKLEDVNRHIGDTVKICNKIYGGNYFNRLPGNLTYLYVGNDYPDNLLAVKIAKEDRENFEDRPEMMYAYKDVCITGKLELDKGKPVIIVKKPEQITTQK